MIKKIALGFLMIVITFGLTGCWLTKDLTKISILGALGMDQEEDGKLTLSVQIIKPSASSGRGEGGGGDEKAFFVVSTTEDTLFAALRGLLDKVEHKIFYSSTQVIVIGESVAKEGIGDMIDFLLRDHETQYKTLVVVTKEVTAKEVLEQEFELSKIPGAYIKGTLKNGESTGFTKEKMLLQMIRELATQGKDLNLPIISKVEDTTQTKGLAVFLKDKQVGLLDQYETRGYLFGTGEIKSTIVEVESPSDPKKKIGVEVTKNSAKQKLEWDEEDKPKMTIKIKVTGNIGEQPKNVDIKEQELINKIEESCNEKIKEEVTATIEKCQKEYNSDIFGIGAAIFDDKPDYWKKVKETWNKEGYPEVEIHVEVETKILKSGLINKSLEIQ